MLYSVLYILLLLLLLALALATCFNETRSDVLMRLVQAPGGTSKCTPSNSKSWIVLATPNTLPGSKQFFTAFIAAMPCTHSRHTISFKNKTLALSLVVCTSALTGHLLSDGIFHEALSDLADAWGQGLLRVREHDGQAQHVYAQPRQMLRTRTVVVRNTAAMLQDCLACVILHFSENLYRTM